MSEDTNRKEESISKLLDKLEDVSIAITEFEKYLLETKQMVENERGFESTDAKLVGMITHVFERFFHPYKEE